MEGQTGTGMAVFKQICEINEIDPQVILEEVGKQPAEKLDENERAEKFIRAALEHRAIALIQSINTAQEAGNAGGEFEIDADPAAPSFQINEELIRSKYDSADAEKIIEVLAQVQLPVW
jgi:hypothetical protein